MAVISKAATEAIEKYTPDVFGIEGLFFSSNVKSALVVAEARGAVLAAAGSVAGLRVVECSPQEVKLAVTGYGAAVRKAVASMIPHLLTLPLKNVLRRAGCDRSWHRRTEQKPSLKGAGTHFIIILFPFIDSSFRRVQNRIHKTTLCTLQLLPVWYIIEGRPY